MRYYPAFINLSGKDTVVIGGGQVAERKVRTLLRAGARVKVISPKVTSGLRRLSDKGKISIIKRRYRKGDLEGAFLIIACTSSRSVNQEIAQDAEGLVNVVDMPDLGNFIVPSTVERGALSIAISTGGASPALSRSIRKELEKLYDREFSLYTKFIERLRKRIIREIPNRTKRKRILKALGSEEILHQLRNKGFREVKKSIEKMLEFSSLT